MSRERGFTLVEMMVALVILTSGSLILVSGSAFVTRDLVRSRQATVAGALAQARMDDLRAAAASTAMPCLSSRFTSSTTPDTVGGVEIQWVVPTSGTQRTVSVMTRYKIGAGRARVDTVRGGITC